MLTITDSAKEHLSKICTDLSAAAAVRLEIKGGGCSGYTYNWELITKEEIQKDDEVFTIDENHKLVVDNVSIFYLAGSKIDYESDVWGAKLEIINPMATANCGCGSSVAF